MPQNRIANKNWKKATAIMTFRNKGCVAAACEASAALNIPASLLVDFLPVGVCSAVLLGSHTVRATLAMKMDF